MPVDEAPAASSSVVSAYAGLTLQGPVVEPGGTIPRASVALGMVASVDGGASIGGVSGDLGAAADAAAFGSLRGACDAILVGAGTVRAEDYGPPVGPAARRRDRRARGLADSPRLVVVSGSLTFATTDRVFADPEHRPIVVTDARAPAARVAALASVAEVLRVGGDGVDLRALLVELAARGLGRVLCEGGPRLNGSLLAAGLVDEVFVTIAPVLIGGGGPRIVQGRREFPTQLHLTGVMELGDEVLLRYAVRR